MKDTFIFYFILCTCSVVLDASEDEYEHDQEKGNSISDESDHPIVNIPTFNCWMTLDAPEHFKTMDEIDDRYAKIRNKIQETLMAKDFDKLMIDGFVSSRGAALRELHAHHHRAWMIPSGINLGGYCMLRMIDSVLFFHRMKLRNNTYFRIDDLHNDMTDMQVRINLALNDLHLKGAYERSLTDDDPSVLIYAPTFGEVEFLLKDVRYKIEGRYRLIKNRLLIEMVNSEIIANDIIMTYLNQAIESSTIRIKKENLGRFMSRLKTDLDKWIKDYFNDYLIHTSMEGIPYMDELSKYDKEKTTALEEYTDNAIQRIRTRLQVLNAQTIGLPMFTFKSIHGLQIKLYEGVIRGLDSMYRRSVATGAKQKNVRKVDTLVGFSNLKLVYKYEAVIPTGMPPLAGVLTLSANELTAHLALAMIDNPETIDLDIEFLDQMKPESLTVEGAANIMISNFKHLLEHEIVATMSNTLIHGIRLLRSLPTCEPFIKGQLLENNETQSKYTQWDEDSNEPSTDNHDKSLPSDVSGEEYKAAQRSPNKRLTSSALHKSNKNLKKRRQTDLKKIKLRNKKS